MKKFSLLVLVSLLALAFAGCAPATSDGQGDGLHSTIPDVKGLEQAAAAAALTEAGYQVGAVTTASDPGSPEGTVIAQDPIPATSAARGSAVDLTVAGP